MRFFNVRSVVGALALCLSASAVHAANSPMYDSWAKLKPGSSVTVKMSSEASGQKSETEMTSVLDSVTDEKVVVEVKTSMVVGGRKMDLPARKTDIPKGTPAAAPTPKPTDPKVGAKVSEETVTIGGKMYKCQVTEAANETNGMKVNSKTWTSTEVPGTLVKSESSTTGAVTSKTVMEVTKIDVK